MRRREFIKLSASASALGLLPSEIGRTLKALNSSVNCDTTNRRLVLIELKGGNDGLNTIIPMDNYSYYKNSLRPDIHIPVNSSNYNSLVVDSSLSGSLQDLAFNPALLTGNNQGFKGLYNAGMLRIMQSVGYPSQNKSHFASIDLWATGNDGNSWDNGKESGWMGRFMENAYAEVFPTNYPFAIQMGSNNTWLGFHAEHEHGLALNIEGQNSENFYTILSGLAGQAPTNIPNTHHGDEINYIVQTDAFSNTYANSIETAYNNGSNYNDSAYYPDTDLSNQLKTVARLIRGGIETKIFLVTIGGFDTHNNQNQSNNDINGRHTELIKELSGAVDAFVSDINSDSIGDDIVGLTFSEFGRKAKQNNNRGTDHGEIAPMFVFGKPVKGGISGNNVDLNEANSNNNWQIQTVQYDYRQVFSTLMQDFLGANDSVIDKTFFDHTNQVSFSDKKISDIIKPNSKLDPSCYSLGISDVKNSNNLIVYPNPAVGLLFIKSSNLKEAEYSIYSLDAKLVMRNKFNFISGEHKIDISNVNSGTYLFELSSNSKKTFKKIIIN